MQEWKVEADQDLCIGSGDCVGWAPEVFELLADDATVRILSGATNVDLESVKDAALSCPTGAIRIVFRDGVSFP
jgi:ferredoxin